MIRSRNGLPPAKIKKWITTSSDRARPIGRRQTGDLLSLAAPDTPVSADCVEARLIQNPIRLGRCVCHAGLSEVSALRAPSLKKSAGMGRAGRMPGIDAIATRFFIVAGPALKCSRKTTRTYAHPQSPCHHWANYPAPRAARHHAISSRRELRQRWLQTAPQPRYRRLRNAASSCHWPSRH